MLRGFASPNFKWLKQQDLIPPQGKPICSLTALRDTLLTFAIWQFHLLIHHKTSCSLNNSCPWLMALISIFTLTFLIVRPPVSGVSPLQHKEDTILPMMFTHHRQLWALRPGLFSSPSYLVSLIFPCKSLWDIDIEGKILNCIKNN